MKKFVSTMRKGFHMTFENGLTVSVQWGAGNYCDNHFPDDMDFSCSKDAQSDTAEVAVMHGRKFLNANHFLPEEDMKTIIQKDKDSAEAMKRMNCLFGIMDMFGSRYL